MYSQAADFSLGINYDPEHSFLYQKATGLDDSVMMKQAIEADLDKLAELQNYNHDQFDQINHLKTFHTVYRSLGVLHPFVQVNIADIIHDWNQKHPKNAVTLALGVWEFAGGAECGNEVDCIQLTQSHIDAAIAAVKRYPGLIDRIIVGNEDMQDSQQIRNRIVKDVDYLKSQLKDDNVRIGTAQIHEEVEKLFNGENSYQGIKNAVDFVGANVYPYWRGMNYYDSFLDPKQYLINYWNSELQLANAQQKEIIITEEGWPSAGYQMGGAVPASYSEHDYFYFWYARNQSMFNVAAPFSYYFALFDKLPGRGTESHWGVYGADGYASILQGDFTKPFAPDHLLLFFKNAVPSHQSFVVNACLADKGNGTCYPLNGYVAGAWGAAGSMVAANESKEFMIDATGDTYQSIKLTQGGANGLDETICYLNVSTLKQFHTKDTLVIDGVDQIHGAFCHVMGVNLPPEEDSSVSSSSSFFTGKK